MSFWLLLQIIVNLVLFTAIFGIWFRMQRPAKDDPRLSKGLQLLQTKISVLEDLSDRSETQVNQLRTLVDQKVKEVQQAIDLAEKEMARIEVSMQKCMDVAKIFQDRIPHKEIIERQNTIKYVKAAKLAHQGVKPDEIAQQVDLSLGEIEFIAKVNRNRLQFSEEDLPDWAKEEALINPASSQTVEAPVEAQPLMKEEDSIASPTLRQLGEQFRKAVNVEAQSPAKIEMQNSNKSTGPAVRKVVFPRVETDA